MKKPTYVVLTDSACDMPYELEERYNIHILNFSITVDGKPYTERVDFDFDEYLQLLRTCEGIPATAQITHLQFVGEFEKYAQQGIQDLLYVAINSTGSGTYNNAVMAKKIFEEKHPDSPMKLHLIDSRSYSMGYGWAVAEAARKLQNGARMSEIVEWLEDWFSKMEIVLGVYTLKYVKKSGRISAAAAFAGELLGLKPIISLTNGTNYVEKKVRGDNSVMPATLNYAAERMDDTCQYMIIGGDDKNMQQFAAMCTKYFKAPPLGCYKVGAAVATNSGPDIIALAYLGAKRS